MVVYQTVKSLRIRLLVSTEYTNVTDSRTDGQTDGHAHTHDGIGRSYA